MLKFLGALAVSAALCGCVVGKYRAGIFDDQTGGELTHDLKPKADGNRVDVST